MMRSCRRTSGHTHRIELHQILLRFAECRAAVWCVPFFGVGTVWLEVSGLFSQNKLQERKQKSGVCRSPVPSVYSINYKRKKKA